MVKLIAAIRFISNFIAVWLNTEEFETMISSFVVMSLFYPIAIPKSYKNWIGGADKFGTKLSSSAMEQFLPYANPISGNNWRNWRTARHQSRTTER